jgi:hypothetical protein
MTVTVSLTQEQEERLRGLCAERGIDSNALLFEIVRKALEKPADSPDPGKRPESSREDGVIRFSGELRALLPEMFWLGVE